VPVAVVALSASTAGRRGRVGDVARRRPGKSGLVPRRLALLGLIAGPLILIRATLILFDVVDPGDATDLLGVPEFIWEAGLGFYPLIKGFRIPPAPVAENPQLRTGTATATTG
jgi:hypothetical protein